MGIQVCSKEGPRPFARGDNYEMAKIFGKLLKYYYPDPLAQYQPNLEHALVKGDKFVEMKGPSFSKGR